MTGGLFNAGSKIDPGSLENDMLSEIPSEKPRASKQINTSRDNVRKSAKSVAALEQEEEEKIFNIEDDEDIEGLSESASHALERATSPGEADAKFAEFFMAIELEMQAETGQLKKSNPDTVDLNYERRMLFTRNKRFDANKELLRKTTEENRLKRGLYGPQTAAAMKKYTEEV